VRTSFCAAPHAPLLFLHPPVCVPPLHAKQRGGGTLPPGWARAPVRLPPLCIHGGRGTASVPVQPPIHAPPLCSSWGEGGRGFPVYARPWLCVALRAKRREGGATSRFAPRLSTWRTNGEGPAPLPHAPCSRTASVQKPRQGGVGLRAAPSLHSPFACNRGHAGSHSHMAARLRVAPVHKLGEEGGPPHCFWDWVWPSHIAVVCERGKEGQRGGLPIPAWPRSRDPLSVACPSPVCA